MTIAIALQVHDGVVLASDSAITLNDPAKTFPDNILNVYNNGNKIFNLIKGWPIGAVFYGNANFGSSSISTLMKDLRRRFAGEDTSMKNWKLNKKNYTVEQVAIKAREFLFDDIFNKLSPKPTDANFGLIVAGYGSDSQLAETWSITIAGQACAAPTISMGQGVSGAVGGGDPDAFLRLVNGFSPQLGKSLLDAGLDPGIVGQVVSTARASLSLNIVEAPMPIQDALGLAEFFVDTTSRLAQFKRGFSTVGGPTESAAITKHEGFRWVKRKHYFDATMNPGVPL